MQIQPTEAAQPRIPDPEGITAPRQRCRADVFARALTLFAQLPKRASAHPTQQNASDLREKYYDGAVTVRGGRGRKARDHGVIGGASPANLLNEVVSRLRLEVPGSLSEGTAKEGQAEDRSHWDTGWCCRTDCASAAAAAGPIS